MKRNEEWNRKKERERQSFYVADAEKAHVALTQR